MKRRYREADLAGLRTVPIADRSARVTLADGATPPGPDRSFHAFLDSLPRVLAADHLRQVAAAMVSAHRAGRGILVMVGGHVIKTGLGPLLSQWVRRGMATHVALNGAAAIHDYELARFGGTSEDVAAGIQDGSFGMTEETGAEMNHAIRAASAAGLGMGEGLAAALTRAPTPGGAASVLVACHAAGVPVTVHPSMGTDIIHQHPAADGAALGETGHRDFRRLAGALPDLHQGGVVLNFGSAVILPEVFLKALTVARNLDQGRPIGFLAADFDMIRHYRPQVNVVERPTTPSGTGILLTGHHEILIPLLAWAVDDLLG